MKLKKVNIRIIALVTAFVMILALFPLYTLVIKAEGGVTHVRLNPNGGKYVRNNANSSSVQDFEYYSGECAAREDGPDSPLFDPLQGQLWSAPGGSNLVFDGWTKDKEGTKPFIYGGTQFYPTEDITLYAKWVNPSEQKDYVSITFNTNGYAVPEEYNSFDSNGQCTLIVKKGLRINTPAMYQDEEQYLRLAWYLDKAGKNQIKRVNSYESDYYIVADKNMTLYAGPEKYKKLTMNTSEGEFYDGSKTQITYFLEGQTIRSIETMNGPGLAQTDKVFAGWYYDSALTKRAKLSDVLTSDTQLYAKLSYPVTITLDAGKNKFEGFGSSTLELDVASDLPLNTIFDTFENGYYISDNNQDYHDVLDENTKMYSDKDLKTQIDTARTNPKNHSTYYLRMDPEIVTVGFNFGDGGLTYTYFPENWAVRVELNETYSNMWDIITNLNGMTVCTPGETVIEGYYKDRNFATKYPEKNIKFTEPTTVYVKFKSPYNSSTKLNGLVKGTDGKWAMYKDGKVQTSYTGLAKNSNGWYYLKNGYVDWNYTGFGQNLDTKVWWRVDKGRVDFNADSIYKKPENGVWYKTAGGKVTWKETGVFNNQNGWYRVVNSRVDWSANGIYKNDKGWWKTTNGKVTFKETGIFKNENGLWYVKGSKVDFNKNGKVKYNGKTYIVTKGRAKLA